MAHIGMMPQNVRLEGLEQEIAGAGSHGCDGLFDIAVKREMEGDGTLTRMIRGRAR